MIGRMPLGLHPVKRTSQQFCRPFFVLEEEYEGWRLGLHEEGDCS